MNFEPKRDWKRYDPEPEEKGCPHCRVEPWELVVRTVTFWIALFCLVNVIAG